MKQNILIITGYVICSFGLLTSCKKNWLDAKPVQSLAIPTTLKDFKSLLSSTTTTPAINSEFGTLIEHGSGDFVISDIDFVNADALTRNVYSWEADLWPDPIADAWNIPYSKIIYANVVLEGIDHIVPQNSSEELDWRQIKGAAYFFRAIWHYDIAKQFCKAYNKSTASTDLGIPLRLSSDFNIPSRRATIEESYNQILSDLKSAVKLLPIATPISNIYKCQPTTAAVNAMLSRVYLAMSNFDSALVYADRTLSLHNSLINYNDSTAGAPGPSNVSTGARPFAIFNSETIFYMQGAGYSVLFPDNHSIATDFLSSYDNNDLRLRFYFARISPNNNIGFVGFYNTNTGLFLGLATDEILLTRAECRARTGDISGAMNDLNTLMRKRWKTGTWIDATATDANTALAKILTERRKELVMRGIRWTDLKRLNLEPQFAVTLTKVINGQSLSLYPNSPLYIFPIPANVIQMTGMQQNIR